MAAMSQHTTLVRKLRSMGCHHLYEGTFLILRPSIPLEIFQERLENANNVKSTFLQVGLKQVTLAIDKFGFVQIDVSTSIKKEQDGTGNGLFSCHLHVPNLVGDLFPVGKRIRCMAADT